MRSVHTEVGGDNSSAEKKMTVDDTIDSITVGWNWGIVGATVLY